MNISIGADVWIVSPDFRPALFRAWVREKVTSESESGTRVSYRVEKHSGAGLIEVYAHHIFPVATHCHDALCMLENNAEKVFFL
jgi:hypothetical protein